MKKNRSQNTGVSWKGTLCATSLLLLACLNTSMLSGCQNDGGEDWFESGSTVGDDDMSMEDTQDSREEDRANFVKGVEEFKPADEGGKQQPDRDLDKDIGLSGGIEE